MKTLLAALGAVFLLSACAADPLLPYADAGDCKEINAAMQKSADRIMTVGNLRGAKNVAIMSAPLAAAAVAGPVAIGVTSVAALLQAISVDTGPDAERIRHLANVKLSKGC
jgi:hypothetical protein